jgi:uncharacterized repeat protein (TIGR03806 family)
VDGGGGTGGAGAAPGRPDAIAPTDAAKSDAPAIPSGPTPAPDGEPYATLSEWSLFSDAPNQVPTEGVVPFEVISVLFADNALKRRFLWIPPGTEIGWSDEGEWSVPVGAIAVKTFYFPIDARDPAQGVRLVETRLLVHEADRWVGHVYVWNEEQTEAERLSTGTTATVSWTNEAGESLDQAYSIPDLNQCQQCHGEGTEMHLLGPRTRQLDRDNDYGNGAENQLDYLASLGWFDLDPPATRVRLVDPYGNGPLVERVRSYFDSNCAHCHSDGGQAHSTNFLVDYESTDPVTGDPSHWGVCKFPTSAGGASGGFMYDVVPGDPDRSILVYRLASTEPDIKMPPILTRLSDPRGVSLMREWIASMPPASCSSSGDGGSAGDAGPDAGSAPEGGSSDGGM